MTPGTELAFCWALFHTRPSKRDNEIHSAVGQQYSNCLQKFKYCLKKLIHFQTFFLQKNCFRNCQRFNLIKIIITMSSRYDRPDPLMLYHQQKSHYQHIVNPRSTIKIDYETRKSLPVQRAPKTSLEKERRRMIQNKKMLTSLLDIYSKRGLLTRIEDDVRAKSKSRKGKKSFFTSYKKEQEQRQIQRNNRDLFHCLLKVQPSIGSQKQWDKHYEHHLKMQKKLCVHLDKDYQGLAQFRSSFNRQKVKKVVSTKEKDVDAKQIVNRQDISTKSAHNRRGLKMLQKMKQIESITKKQENEQ